MKFIVNNNSHIYIHIEKRQLYGYFRHHRPIDQHPVFQTLWIITIYNQIEYDKFAFKASEHIIQVPTYKHMTPSFISWCPTNKNHWIPPPQTRLKTLSAKQDSRCQNLLNLDHVSLRGRTRRAGTRSRTWVITYNKIVREKHTTRTEFPAVIYCARIRFFRKRNRNGKPGGIRLIHYCACLRLDIRIFPPTICMYALHEHLNARARNKSRYDNLYSLYFAYMLSFRLYMIYTILYIPMAYVIDLEKIYIAYFA